MKSIVYILGILFVVHSANAEDAPSAENTVAEEIATAPASGEVAVADEDMKQAAEWAEESKIPVLKSASVAQVEKKPATTSRVLVSLGIIVSLIFGFSLFIKKVLKKSPLSKNSQIKILTQHFLGPKKSLAIIRVAGESMLIGVTDQNINLIKTLALLDEEIPAETPKDFSKSYQSLIQSEADEKEDFSISKIKDFVSGRLKNMKEI